EYCSATTRFLAHSLSLVFVASGDPPDLHSFPTRRSSDLRDVRDPGPLVHPGSPGWQQPVAPHRKKNPRLPVLEHEQHRRHRDDRSEEHTSELQSLAYLVCRLLLEKKKTR